MMTTTPPASSALLGELAWLLVVFSFPFFLLFPYGLWHVF